MPAEQVGQITTGLQPSGPKGGGDAGKEQTGSQSYIPADEKNDKALSMAEELLRGTQVNSAFPPNVKDLSSQN